LRNRSAAGDNRLPTDGAALYEPQQRNRALGSGPIKYAFEASKWRTYLPEMSEGDSGSIFKDISG
jgi:hypothetical protein